MIRFVLIRCDSMYNDKFICVMNELIDTYDQNCKIIIDSKKNDIIDDAAENPQSVTVVEWSEVYES